MGAVGFGYWRWGIVAGSWIATGVPCECKVLMTETSRARARVCVS